MIDKTGMLSTKTTVTRKPRKGLMRFVRGRGLRRLTVYFTRFYAVLIRILCHWRWAVCILLLLGFGLPVFSYRKSWMEKGDGKNFIMRL